MIPLSISCKRSLQKSSVSVQDRNSEQTILVSRDGDSQLLGNERGKNVH